jgi:chitin synthase
MFQVCTWDFGLESDTLKGRRINFIFALKQRNDGKINSHKWFFQGVCKYLKPEYTLMLDIGTRADDYAIAKLYKYMMQNKDCGGCCGEIEVDFSTHANYDISYLVKAAQFYEYKLSHSPDKACESFFGYNSVLPGAYSLFRWQAIQGGPMDKFFKLVNSDADPSCPEANEYLAEDRVMCLQIYIKEKAGFYLTYIPDAKAFTDAPENLTILIKQRRRWMNGALFAAFRVLGNFYAMVSCSRGTHGCLRQLGMCVYLCYFATMQLLSFFMVGSFYVSIKLFFE